MNIKRSSIIVALLLSLVLTLSGCGADNTKTQNTKETLAYPEKPIRLVIDKDPGPGPDTFDRKIADLMSKKYGWKFEIINLAEENGMKAYNEVWNAPHDGYTILGETENMMLYPVLGQATQTAKDWTFFESLQEPALIVVKADSKYKTIADLVNDAKANPNSISIGNTGLGRSFHLKVKALEKVTGAQFGHVPFRGGKGSVEALESGQVAALSFPRVLVIKDIQEGKLRPIATTDLSPVNFGGNIGIVDSIAATYPEYKKYMPMDATVGFAMPADVPKDVVEKFGKAFEDVIDSPEMSDFISNFGSIKINLWGEDAREYMMKTESNFSWLAQDFGLTKVDPATLGIPKP